MRPGSSPSALVLKSQGVGVSPPRIFCFLLGKVGVPPVRTMVRGRVCVRASEVHDRVWYHRCASRDPLENPRVTVRGMTLYKSLKLLTRFPGSFRVKLSWCFSTAKLRPPEYPRVFLGVSFSLGKGKGPGRPVGAPPYRGGRPAPAPKPRHQYGPRNRGGQGHGTTGNLGPGRVEISRYNLPRS